MTLRSGVELPLLALSRWLLVDRHNGEEVLIFALVPISFGGHTLCIFLLRPIYKEPNIHISYVVHFVPAM